MPVEFSPPAVLDPGDPLVDATPANDPSGVRRKPGEATPAGFSWRDVIVAEHERWDPPENGASLHLDGWPPLARSLAIRRPPGMGAFQFVVLAKLRAAQLMRGCRPRVDGFHKATVTAQLEVSEGKVSQLLQGNPAAIGVVPIEDVPAMVVET
jgi:hypothetical protein